MAQKVINKKVKSDDGIEYNINFSTLGGLEALRLKLELSVIILPTINGMFKNVSSFFQVARAAKDNKRAIGDPKNFEGVKFNFEEVLEKLVERIEPDKFIELAQKLLKDVTAANAKTKETFQLDESVPFDELFSGDIALLYKILWVVLEANYGSLFKWSDIGK